jgi:hypothetical protein
MSDQEKAEAIFYSTLTIRIQETVTLMIERYPHMIVSSALMRALAKMMIGVEGTADIKNSLNRSIRYLRNVVKELDVPERVDRKATVFTAMIARREAGLD